ncbi:MAG: site-2 protease family protein [Sarcina sp.]
MGDFLLGKFLMIPGILILFTVKEYVRSLVAYKLGDKSQKLQGRLTLDPFAHVDFIGFIMIILVNFGWSKPPQINRNAFKNPKKDSLKVTIAAFASYLVIALIALFIYVILMATNVLSGALGFIVTQIFLSTALVCISLFVFNLIPMPGLEMFYIITEVNPGLAYRIMAFTAQYQLIILLAIVLAADFVLSYPVGLILKGLLNIVVMIVGLIL